MEEGQLTNLMKNGKKLFDNGHYIQAIEKFSALVIEGDYVARQYLARCYFRLEMYDVAKKHFTDLANNAQDLIKEYAVAMIAVINEMNGDVNQAIKLLRTLPSNPRNLINLSIMYWKKYKRIKEEFSILEAERILNKINIDCLPNKFIKIVYHLKALIFQEQGIFSYAEIFYKKALSFAESDIEKGRILNDFASLFIKAYKYEMAEKILLKARRLVEKESELQLAFNNKWMGILKKAQEDLESSEFFLESALSVIRDKGLAQEAAIVSYLLTELSDKEGLSFYKAATYYANGLDHETLLSKIEDKDEKVCDLISDNFFSSK